MKSLGGIGGFDGVEVAAAKLCERHPSRLFDPI